MKHGDVPVLKLFLHYSKKKQTENLLEEWHLLIARAVIPSALRPAKGSGRFCRVTGSLTWAKDNHLSTGPEVAKKHLFWSEKLGSYTGDADISWLKYGMLGQLWG